MDLSKENYDKLDANILYKTEPVIDNSFSVGNVSSTYHCKNWTFRVHKYDDCSAWMFDTYFNSWDSHKIKITDANIDKFEVVFNTTEVKRIGDDEYDEYNPEDLYYVATNSGGYSCGHLYWVKKDSKKSKELLIYKKTQEIDSLKRQLDWAEYDLKRLME